MKNIARDSKTDALVLQSGSIEITDINVNEALQDTKKDIREYKKDWFAKIENDSTNLFNIAEEALANSNDIKKVFIVKRLPRYDRAPDDILQIKSQLSQFGNAQYDCLWLKRGSPKNIHIVEIEGLECSGYMKELVYGNPVRKNYDGVHLRGDGAARQFTYRAIKSLKQILCRAKSPSRQRPVHVNDRPNVHNNCPQQQYKSHVKKNRAKFGKPNYVGAPDVRLYSEVAAEGSIHSYQVPTANRFNPLN